MLQVLLHSNLNSKHSRIYPENTKDLSKRRILAAVSKFIYSEKATGREGSKIVDFT